MIATNEPVRIDPRRELIDELFEQSNGQPRCKHIRRDDSGEPYCGKGLANGAEVGETRRMVCDTASLQLYCLDGPERHTVCIYYQGEPLD